MQMNDSTTSEITEVYKGKFFNAWFVDETLEVVPIEDIAHDCCYARSEAMAMRDELDALLKKADEVDPRNNNN